MSSEHTEHQSSEQQQLARDLSAASTQPPAEVKGYDLQRLVGSGAYGEVWAGVNRNTRRRVAVKFYNHGQGVDWLHLSREVEKLVVLSADRYVVQLHEVGWDAKPPYYVMDYIENGSLEDYLAKSGPMEGADAVELFCEIAQGLQHAHSKGVLHCDLKPANVLLDEDGQPRLADFGQSRLSTDQSPALGTLFYMAPEQADLKAVPDARWDVYALGALLYCMLTGSPPYRREESVEQIENAADLADRLARYRNVLRQSPAPNEHRKTRGVDRDLADLIDRMLAVDPEERIPSVEKVLDALRHRAQLRSRRPLVVLGLVGPLALLLVTALFGMRGYEQAMNRSTAGIVEKTRENNEWASQFAASVASHEIARYFELVERVATEPSFLNRFQPTIDHPEIVKLAPQLSDPRKNESLQALREEFIAHPVRQELQAYLEQLLVDDGLPTTAVWFATNADGTQLAVAYQQPPTSSPIGKNFSYRTYYHGGADDYQSEQDEFAPFGARIQQTRLSRAFRGSGNQAWQVAISTPVYRNGRPDAPFLGVLGVAVEIGNLVKFESTDRQFAVLIDNRPGENRGAILQHPLYEKLIADGDRLPAEFAEVRLDVETLNHGRLYRDPLCKAPGGDVFDRDWIAAAAPVHLRRGQEENDTGLLVLVQEDYQAAVAPVSALARRLVREAVTAFVVVGLVIALLWAVVFRSFRLRRNARPLTGHRDAPTPIASMDTIPASGQS